MGKKGFDIRGDEGKERVFEERRQSKFPFRKEWVDITGEVDPQRLEKILQQHRHTQKISQGRQHEARVEQKRKVEADESRKKRVAAGLPPEEPAQKLDGSGYNATYASDVEAGLEIGGGPKYSAEAVATMNENLRKNIGKGRKIYGQTEQTVEPDRRQQAAVDRLNRETAMTDLTEGKLRRKKEEMKKQKNVKPQPTGKEKEGLTLKKAKEALVEQRLQEREQEKRRIQSAGAETPADRQAWIDGLTFEDDDPNKLEKLKDKKS